jgi:hypothetical protein
MFHPFASPIFFFTSFIQHTRVNTHTHTHTHAPSPLHNTIYTLYSPHSPLN